MPLPTGMSLQCGGAKALGKTGLGGGGAGRVLEGGSSAGSVCWNGAKMLLEGVLALEGSAGRVRWKGFQRWKGGSSRVPPRGSSAESGSGRGSSRGSSTYRITRFTCISSSFTLQRMSGRNGYSGTSRWPSRRREGTVHYLWWTACRTRGRPARWRLGQRVEQRSRGPWPSSCFSYVKRRGTTLWSSMWRQRAA